MIPTNETDSYYSSLPWVEAQAQLALQVPTGIKLSATCGWHGTKTNAVIGAFALVHPDGPLADLLGKRIRVTTTSALIAPRYVYALVIASDASIFEHLSLTRRSFLTLAPLWTEELNVVVEELG